LHDAPSYIFRVAELICPIPDRLFSLSASQHSHRFRQIKPGRSFMFGEKKPTDEINVRSRIFKHCINQGDNLIVRP
ncbi:hypothetical protein, partial [Stutzerimonas stutzeri]|uniref:hypothetical protein n=1 Tax=Stutzerimonas stutzeri TaxID=316 RepID=UPI001EF55EA5